MKTVEDLIKRVRRETRNATRTGVSAGDSIDDIEFIDGLNDAQELCQESISGVFSKFFETTKIYTIDTTADNYEELDIPADCLLGTRIVSVEFSHDGTEANYFNLNPLDIRQRYSQTGGTYSRTPEGYMRTADKIIITPLPSQTGSKVRVVYERRRLRLDVAKVSTCTGASQSSLDLTLTYVAAALADTDNDGTTDIDGWDIGDTVNVIDKSNQEMIIQDGVITSISATTMLIDMTNATYVQATVTSAITISGNIQVIEGGRTNTSELPDSCEKYLTAYAGLVILERDSSTRLAKAAEEKFKRISDSLIKSYIQEARDWPAIPETDY